MSYSAISKPTDENGIQLSIKRIGGLMRYRDDENVFYRPAKTLSIDAANYNREKYAMISCVFLPG